MCDSEAQSPGRQSPSRLSRIKEKEELQNLNDRFAGYIEVVRQLKEQNLKLETELIAVKEQHGLGNDGIKELYETELSDTRALLDETAKEKAKQQLLASKAGERVAELEDEVKKLKEEIARLEAQLSTAEHNLTNADSQRQAVLREKNRLQKALTAVENQLAELRDELNEAKEALSAETLAKVDLQNHIQSLQEEMSFKQRTHVQELASLRGRMTVMQSESTKLEVDFQHQLDSRLEQIMDELREQSESDVQQYKQDLEEMYSGKIQKLESQSTNDSRTIGHLSGEMKRVNDALRNSNADLSKYQATIDRLENTVRAKEEDLSTERTRHQSSVTMYVSQLRDLRVDYEDKIKEYENLMDIKVALDQEIATYRSLLEEEEDRLKLTPTPRKKRTHAQTSVAIVERDSAKKRRRCEHDDVTSANVSTSASGFIQIVDVDHKGNYVQIKNMSDQTESIGGFRIHHHIEEEPEIVFKFHSKSRLQGGALVTVWSAGAGVEHKPPTDIVWKSQNNWGEGANSSTSLHNSAGDIIATFIQRNEHTSTVTYTDIDEDTEADGGSKSYDVTKATTSAASSGTVAGASYSSSHSSSSEGQQEHLFHKEVDPEDAGKKERCLVS